jgi:hypothetical protein
MFSFVEANNSVQSVFNRVFVTLFFASVFGQRTATSSWEKMDAKREFGMIDVFTTHIRVNDFEDDSVA